MNQDWLLSTISSRLVTEGLVSVWCRWKGWCLQQDNADKREMAFIASKDWNAIINLNTELSVNQTPFQGGMDTLDFIQSKAECNGFILMQMDEGHVLRTDPR